PEERCNGAYSYRPSSCPKQERNTSLPNKRLKFLVHIVLVQFLTAATTPFRESARFFRLRRQHAAQIRDCLVVDRTFLDNNTCNWLMILDSREKTFFTGHPLYRLISTAGASGAVWHATVFP